MKSIASFVKYTLKGVEIIRFSTFIMIPKCNYAFKMTLKFNNL